MEIACLDLEGVLIPEIWINFAQKTGIDELRATTRDVPDYNVLMDQRLRILQSNRLGLAQIQEVIHSMGPLPGAREFLDWLRERDTFYEFAAPLMRQLGYPTLLCHQLHIDEQGFIKDYRLRQKDPKRQCVKAFKGLNFRVIAAGDSYNDTSMLIEAHRGILFRPPPNVIEEFPQFPVSTNYLECRNEFRAASVRDIEP